MSKTLGRSTEIFPCDVPRGLLRKALVFVQSYQKVSRETFWFYSGCAARTLAPGRSQVNLIATRKREHSRKPDQFYPIIEACSSGPYLELFARGARRGWQVWGNQSDADFSPNWPTYKNSSAALIAAE
jgi:MT-A70